VARFNDLITKRLLDGCLEGLHRHNVAASDVTVAWVPGSYEIPVACKTMAKSGKYDAIVCIGAVIKGAVRIFSPLRSKISLAHPTPRGMIKTAHFDYVAGGAANGIMNAQLQHSGPLHSSPSFPIFMDCCVGEETRWCPAYLAC
jgi:6,7-dimethyl-8-ribityllumazine synthase